MNKIIYMSLMIMMFSACSEESQPYVEVNTSTTIHETGYIDTH